MNRADAVDYLVDITPLATEAGLAVEDSPSGFKSAIDKALGQLGYGFSEVAGAEVDDSDAQDLIALTEYFALETIYRRFALKTDVQLEGPQSKKFSQQFTQTAKLRDDARKKLEEMGFLTGSFELGELGLGLIEAEATEL